jgi:hypothetical protein
MNQPFRPGDLVSRVAAELGFRECAGCKRRKAAMNAVDMNQSPLGVAADLVKAVVSPPELSEPLAETSEPSPESQKA